MLLDEQWKLKKNYTNLITNSAINKIYNTAKNAGAIGGKLLGAGGGGFMLFYVKKNSQSRVRQASETCYMFLLSLKKMEVRSYMLQSNFYE